MSAAIPQHIGQQLWRFPGGVRLRHFKQMSCQASIRTLPPPRTLLVPLNQQAGGLAQPVVEVGQRVKAGNLIARTDGVAGIGLHAPTSGIIAAIEDRPLCHPSALAGPTIVLDADGEDEWRSWPVLRWQDLSAAELRAAIAERGIVGLGGALFPTHRKLDSNADTRLLILNGAECEPYIACDEMLMRERPQQIIAGALIMLGAMEVDRCVIGIEDTMGGVRQTLMKAVDAANAADRISVVKVPTIYPEGGERQLIKVLTGLEVPGGGYPADIGIVCNNVATAAAVHQAIDRGIPSVSRIVTITGPGVRQPGNYEIRIGTPIADAMQAAGGYEPGAARLIVGGPMMGFALPSDEPPVTKATNCLLVLMPEDLEPRGPELPCIRCGECERVCPARLLPQQLLFFAQANDHEALLDHDLFDCIDCGCCAYVCPSQIPLVDYYRAAKADLKQREKEQERAERSRRRFEARQERLDAAEQARAARLEKRKARLRSAGADAVAAAVARAKEKKSTTREDSGE